MKCNLCGSNQFDSLYPNILKCNNCGLVCLDFIPEEIHKYYSENYFNEKLIASNASYLESEKLRKKDFSERLKEIEKYKTRGILLDVGCATGFFMEVADKSGWITHGVDISEYAISQVKYGSAYVGQLKDMDFKCKFDLVTMFDVIEHDSDPKGLLKEANKSLVKDGLLVITTPNIDSLCSKVFKERFHLLDKLHLFYFSPDTIKKMLEQTGFKVLKTTYPYFRTQFFNLRELYYLIKGLLSGGSSRSFYGNMMCIYAVKNEN